MTVLSHSETYQIRTYEIDPYGLISIPALLRLLQEVATQHVLKLKLSYWDLAPKNLSWILLRQHLWVNQLPPHGSTLTIKTWPTGFEKLFTFRDFRVFDENGDEIIRASSAWLLMDTQTRRMSRIPPFITQIADQLLPEQEWLPRPTDRITLPEQFDQKTNFRVNWHDLDFNGHLNNTLYVQWMLDSVGRMHLDQWELMELEIHYRAEAILDDQLQARSAQVGPTGFFHRLVKTENGKDLAIARTKWRPRKQME